MAVLESHDLADYLEAHRLWRTVGEVQQAGKLVMQLVEAFRRFGLSPPSYEQGIAEKLQQFAVALVEAQLPPEEAALGKFFGCLVASLLGETPEILSLEAPFTELWQAFQDTLNEPSSQ